LKKALRRCDDQEKSESLVGAVPMKYEGDEGLGIGVDRLPLVEGPGTGESGLNSAGLGLEVGELGLYGRGTGLKDKGTDGSGTGDGG
jgi:hypothetical protein